MNIWNDLFLHFLSAIALLCRPGGTKSLVAENLALKQQLLVLKRSRNGSPKTQTFDRLVLGFLASLIQPNRIEQISIVFKPATILKFHQALVKRKYKLIFSNKIKRKVGRKPPSDEVIQLVLQLKNKKPSFGYTRISMQIFQGFGIDISPWAVGRILKKNNGFPMHGGDGPSWLTFIGHMKDSLWSADLFRCESISLRSHWVMVILDQYTRRIIGFAVHAGDPSGVDVCRMFNEIVSGKQLPKYLISDNDPLFEFHRWKANLRVLDIEEIKSMPYNPNSHPFIERLISSCRSEFLDQSLFWNATDLQRKLDSYKSYYNKSRGHSSLNSRAPVQVSLNFKVHQTVQPINNYVWETHCRGLYHLPIAA
jgi:putative transposase